MSETMVNVPRNLTTENGSKTALIGEFHVNYEVCCTECDGDGCEDCNNEGEWIEKQPIPWTTIKEIYAAAIEHFESGKGPV